MNLDRDSPNTGSDDDFDSSDASSIIDISLLTPNNPALQETFIVAAKEQEIAEEEEEVAKKAATSTTSKENETKDPMNTPTTGSQQDVDYASMLQENEKNQEKQSTSSPPPTSNNNAIRIVMGKSVRRWQQQYRIHHHRRLLQQDKGEKDSVDESFGSFAIEEHILVRQSVSDNTTSMFEGSKITSISKNELQLQQTKKEKKTNVLHTAKVFHQFSGNNIPSMLDCVGIWDEIKQVYVLEIPDYVTTTDLVVLKDPSIGNVTPALPQLQVQLHHHNDLMMMINCSYPRIPSNKIDKQNYG